MNDYHDPSKTIAISVLAIGQNGLRINSTRRYAALKVQHFNVFETNFQNIDRFSGEKETIFAATHQVIEIINH